MITKKTFADAADIMEKERKIIGYFMNPKVGCGYCCAGALMKASGLKVLSTYACFDNVSEWCSDANKSPVIMQFARTIVALPESGYPLKAIYNFSDNNTQEVVVKAMRDFANESSD